MAVKILAVDDSVTMRKILEMTFAGEDVAVSAVPSADNALAVAAQMQPDIVIADASLEGTDGYTLSASIKSNPSLAQTAVVLLASQHSPFDVARGKSSGVDDHVIKPFDTQALIDKVSAVLGQPRASADAGAVAAAAAAPRAPAPPAPAAARPSAPKPPAPAAAPRQAPRAPAPPARQAPPKPAPPRPAAPKAPPRPAASARPKSATSTTQSFGGAAPAPAPVAHAAAEATASTGDLAQRLTAMGLSADQVAGVLALSREVIEQVVWEVVPDLAETIIREEIRRLTTP